MERPGRELPDEKSLDELLPLELRFLADREIASLHGFPASFCFPPSVSRKKRYQLLGNSLSVQVVARLLEHLLDPASEDSNQPGDSEASGSRGPPVGLPVAADEGAGSQSAHG